MNIKNEATHASVRRLAELTGLSQTAAEGEAVRRRLSELEGAATGRAARIDIVVHQLQVELTPAERDALRGADEDLFDRAGLPR